MGGAMRHLSQSQVSATGWARFHFYATHLDCYILQQKKNRLDKTFENIQCARQERREVFGD